MVRFESVPFDKKKSTVRLRQTAVNNETHQSVSDINDTRLMSETKTEQFWLFQKNENKKEDDKSFGGPGCTIFCLVG